MSSRPGQPVLCRENLSQKSKTKQTKPWNCLLHCISQALNLPETLVPIRYYKVSIRLGSTFVVRAVTLASRRQRSDNNDIKASQGLIARAYLNKQTKLNKRISNINSRTVHHFNYCIVLFSGWKQLLIAFRT